MAYKRSRNNNTVYTRYRVISVSPATRKRDNALYNLLPEARNAATGGIERAGGRGEEENELTIGTEKEKCRVMARAMWRTGENTANNKFSSRSPVMYVALFLFFFFSFSSPSRFASSRCSRRLRARGDKSRWKMRIGRGGKKKRKRDERKNTRRSRATLNYSLTTPRRGRTLRRGRKPRVHSRSVLLQRTLRFALFLAA